MKRKISLLKVGPYIPPTGTSKVAKMDILPHFTYIDNNVASTRKLYLQKPHISKQVLYGKY